MYVDWLAIPEHRRGMGLRGVLVLRAWLAQTQGDPPWTGPPPLLASGTEATR